MIDNKKGKFWDKGIQLVDGCDKKSPGCLNCWSEKATARFKRVPEVLTDDCFNGNVIFNFHLLVKALKKRKPHVFAIWNDLYHKGISDEQILSVFSLIRRYNKIRERKLPLHTFLIVTKRPKRAADLIKRLWVMASGELLFLDHSNENAISKAEVTFKKFWPNVWHIVTTENQLYFKPRVEHLFNIPGKRAIIIEPMLGEINLSDIVYEGSFCNECLWSGPIEATINDYSGEDVNYICPQCSESNLEDFNQSPIHQVILGAETGFRGRPIIYEYVRSVRDQCKAAGIPFYLKSLGDKKGRILDGRTHDDLAWIKK